MPPTDTTVATDLPGTPWLGLLGLFLALGAVWWGLRWLGSRWGARGWARLLLGVAGAGVLTGALWAGFTLLGRGFPFSSSWPTIVVALIGAVSAEILLWLYELERGIVTSRRGFWLMALRLSALAVLLFILLQPSHTYLVTREISREVAILVDDSESMHISDSRLTPLEQLDRALVLDVPAALKRPALASLRSHLGTFRDRLATEVAAFQDTPNPEVALAARGETLTGVLSEMETEAKGPLRPSQNPPRGPSQSPRRSHWACRGHEGPACRRGGTMVGRSPQRHREQGCENGAGSSQFVSRSGFSFPGVVHRA